MSRRAIVWYRRDLRVADLPALHGALDAADEVACLFVLDRRLLGGAGSGASKRAFLYGALAALDRDLRALDARLAVREGDPARVLPELAAELGAGEVHCSREYTPWAKRRDSAVAGALEAKGMRLRQHPGLYLSDLDAVRTGDGGPFKVYTPFAKAARALGWDDPLPAPARIPSPGRVPGGTGLPAKAGFDLDGAVGAFPPDPSSALERLRWFARGPVRDYADRRDQLGADGTSKLSAYLRLGLLSPRQVVAALPAGGRGRAAYVGELLWRDFYAAVLHHWPDSAWDDFRPEFGALKWEHDPDGLAAWREGRTGYPLVDAGMRQLVATGWMHNRARMVSASFLTKHLLVDWREGARFFLEHLVDGDLAANNGGWQWVAGSGTDAQPSYRVFNPTRQAERFDPDGAYIRRWLPELATGRGGYPAPIVDHDEARTRALARFEAVKSSR